MIDTTRIPAVEYQHRQQGPGDNSLCPSISTSMPPVSRLTYRPDIDGLRAIAVIAVIAFHASARTLPGGFAGVDIFFVISGCLITALVCNGLENNDFRFADFYLRRIKRILPAYIAVSLFTLAGSSYLLIPNDYIFYTTSLAASWGFASNLFFSMLSWGYFGKRPEEFPLLHTWSLSVEEQFYFIFPLLLFIVFRYFRSRLVSIFIMLALLFLGLSEWNIGEVKSYFLLTSRAHELLIGALAFFLLRKFPPRSPLVSNFFSICGVSMILGAFFLLSRGTDFPGINSLYPCVGTALLLYSGSMKNIASRILESRPLTFIGLVSYPLYLWHWPVFSFMRYRRIEITFWSGTAAIALSFALACATWKMIERPIRSSRWMSFKQAFLALYLVPCVLFMSAGLYSYRTEGAPDRFPSEIRQLISSYSFERDLARSCSTRASEYRKLTVNYLLDHCAFGELTKKNPDILLTGDSHANHFKPFVEQLSKDAGMKAVFHVQGGCFPTDLVDSLSAADARREPDACQKRNADLLQIAGYFKFIVLAGFWSSEPDANFEKKLEYLVKGIIDAGATPVVFKDNPSYETDLSQCILFKKRGWVTEDENCNIPYGYVMRTQASTATAIDNVGLRFPQMRIIDPKRVMCNLQECATYIGNTALYKDGNHLNAKAAGLLGSHYLQREGNPFSDARNGSAAHDS
jgi:peptidoglycan/LPS O-acetylase OafA/YrhL